MNIKELVKVAQRQGWDVQMTRKSHLRFVPPEKEKQIIICSGTPSDQRSLRNTLSQLRRSGLIWGQR